MANKKFDLAIHINPELSQYVDQVLFPEQVAAATAFLHEAGLPPTDQQEAAKPEKNQLPVQLRATDLDGFMRELLEKSTDDSPAIRYFPSDELLDNFLDILPKKPEREVKAVLELLLVQHHGTFKQYTQQQEVNNSSPAEQQSFASWKNYYNLAWVLNLIPAFPLAAIKGIDAYLLANQPVLSKHYADALINCEAIIRTRFLPHIKPKQLLDELGAREFELLIASLYERLGYSTQVRDAAADQYYDILASYFDEARPVTLLIQCRVTERAVSLAETRRLFTAVRATGSGKGVLVTTSKFSAEATRFAAAKANLELIDYEHLLTLLTTNLGSHWSSKVDQYINEQKPRQLALK